jgi:hypothetical protein
MESLYESEIETGREIGGGDHFWRGGAGSKKSSPFWSLVWIEQKKIRMKLLVIMLYFNNFSLVFFNF